MGKLAYYLVAAGGLLLAYNQVDVFLADQVAAVARVLYYAQ